MISHFSFQIPRHEVEENVLMRSFTTFSPGIKLDGRVQCL